MIEVFSMPLQSRNTIKKISNLMCSKKNMVLESLVKKGYFSTGGYLESWKDVLKELRKM